LHAREEHAVVAVVLAEQGGEHLVAGGQDGPCDRCGVHGSDRRTAAGAVPTAGWTPNSPRARRARRPPVSSATPPAAPGPARSSARRPAPRPAPGRPRRPRRPAAAAPERKAG